MYIIEKNIKYVYCKLHKQIGIKSCYQYLKASYLCLKHRGTVSILNVNVPLSIAHNTQ